MSVDVIYNHEKIPYSLVCHRMRPTMPNIHVVVFFFDATQIIKYRMFVLSFMQEGRISKKKLPWLSIQKCGIPKNYHTALVNNKLAVYQREQTLTIVRCLAN